jgi:hypothetical protein
MRREAALAEPRPKPPAARLPTLTEVVLEGGARPPLPPAPAEPPPAAVEPAVDEARIVDAVMAGLQPRIDLMLEYRLREALGPLLARATESIVQEARAELAHTLRDVVARAVSQEVVRRRTR